MKKGGFMKDALILCVITLISGACLGGVYEVTKGPIEAAQKAAAEAAYRVVLPAASSFEAGGMDEALAKANSEVGSQGFGNVMVDDCVTGLDASGATVGHVVTTTSKDGYGGAITISVGINVDGSIGAIEFLTIGETVGFGMNATEPSWKGQFDGKNVDSFSLTKNGASADNEIDAISGATITSNAVTGAVNAAVYFAKNCLAQ